MSPKRFTLNIEHSWQSQAAKPSGQLNIERREDDAKLEDDRKDRSGSAHDVVRSRWSSCRERSNLDQKTSPVGIYTSRGLKQSIKN